MLRPVRIIVVFGSSKTITLTAETVNRDRATKVQSSSHNVSQRSNSLACYVTTRFESSNFLSSVRRPLSAVRLTAVRQQPKYFAPARFDAPASYVGPHGRLAKTIARFNPHAEQAKPDGPGVQASSHKRFIIHDKRPFITSHSKHRQ